MSDIRTASVEPASDRLPGGVLLQVGPFVILALGALWLAAHWDQLPARLPIHWNIRGEVNRTVARSIPGAALPLLLGASLSLMMLGMQVAILRGAPRADMRPAMLRLLLAGEYFVALICCGVLASTVTSGRLLAPVLAASFAGVLALLVVTFLIVRNAAPTPPRNPNAWRGPFYVDRDDPALFVPKRFGVGYTFNFGNPLAVAMAVGGLVIPLLFALLALSVR
jgi:uncharacterized membrane protein